MTALQEKIADLQRDYEHNKDTLGLLHDRLRGMDQELALRSRAYSDYTKFLNCGYQQIRHSLKDKELLIDFVDYESANGNRQYAAYLIRKNQKYPLLLRLFTQNDLDRLLRGQTADVLYSPEKSAEMLALLWKQIRPYASEGSTVYYVPSGKIYQMALESFITSDGCLLGEDYRFVRLSSAREIIRQEWNIEFAFEGRRFWNLRRWLTATEELNSALYGWNILGKTAQQFYNNFEGPVVVWSKREFIAPRDYLFPIRSEEVLVSGCVQNPGW